MSEDVFAERRRIQAGRVTRHWGLKGEVVVELGVAEPAGLLRASRLRAGAAGSPEREVTVLAARRYGAGRAVARLAGVESPEAAAALRGATLWVDREALPPAPEGTELAVDYIGARVVTTAGREVGRVREIRETGGADLLVVTDGGRERLIPFVDAICTRVDLQRGLIEIDPPEGLLDLE